MNDSIDIYYPWYFGRFYIILNLISYLVGLVFIIYIFIFPHGIIENIIISIIGFGILYLLFKTVKYHRYNYPYLIQLTGENIILHFLLNKSEFREIKDIKKITWQEKEFNIVLYIHDRNHIIGMNNKIKNLDILEQVIRKLNTNCEILK